MAAETGADMEVLRRGECLEPAASDQTEFGRCLNFGLEIGLT